MSNHQTKAAKISLVVSFCVLALKFIAYFYTNSTAILSDALETITNVVTAIVGLIVLKYALEPADENHPYGHGRIEPLLTFFIVLILTASAGWIAYEAIQSLTSVQTAPKTWTLIVIIGAIVWKEMMFHFMNAKAKRFHSTSLKAEAWHQRSDAVVSIAAFLGILISVVMGKGYETADEWAALVAAGFIVVNAYKILRPAISEFMDEHVYHDMVAEIEQLSLTVPGIINTEKCFIRKVGTTYAIELHARVEGSISVTEGHEIAHRLKDRICQEKPEVKHVNIHIEPA